MPAVAAIPIIIELIAPAIATTIGEALLPSAIASSTIIGTSTTVASVAGGAIIGAGTAAVSAAITGQDIGKAAIGGAVGGAVTPIATSTLQGVLGSTLGTTAAGRALTAGLSSGGGREIGGIASGLATGQDIGTAARGAAPSAIASGVFGAGKEAFGQAGVDTSTDAGRVISALGQAGLANILASQPAFKGAAAQPSLATGAATTPAPAQAVIQRASTTPAGSAITSLPFGGGAGVPVFGSEAQAAPTGAWGQKTLRSTDTETA